jgi:hypothetical protein
MELGDFAMERRMLKGIQGPERNVSDRTTRVVAA